MEVPREPVAQSTEASSAVGVAWALSQGPVSDPLVGSLLPVGLTTPRGLGRQALTFLQGTNPVQGLAVSVGMGCELLARWL